MMFIAVFSMTAKFVSATLGQLYRTVHEDGSISGGPMYYLDQGLKEIGFGGFGKVLGVKLRANNTELIFEVET